MQFYTQEPIKISDYLRNDVDMGKAFDTVADIWGGEASVFMTVAEHVTLIMFTYLNDDPPHSAG